MKSHIKTALAFEDKRKKLIAAGKFNQALLTYKKPKNLLYICKK